jgi:hypothetical protein
MPAYRSAVWFNLVSLFLVTALVIAVALFGSSVGTLFLPPVSPRSLDERLLTHTFQILCAVPAIACAFSWGVLQTLQPNGKKNRFILGSACVTGGFLLNEIFRFHILLLQAGIPKLLTCLVYAALFSYYGFVFRRTIRSTPYLLLIFGLSLLFIGIVVDSLHIHGDGFPRLLEGIPKLFSEINIVLYFWLVCHQELVRSLRSGVRS